MNYEINKKSNVKKMINNFVSSRNASTALVIDAETLLTSTALYESGMKKKNITVLNNDPSIVAYAISIGFNAVCGITTHILSKIGGKFDIIYWDYCGFPQARSDGFNPAVDLVWGAEHLTKKGIMLATFCRRATDCVENAENMIPHAVLHAKTYVYHETCAMMLMIMVRKNPRQTRDKFNELTVATRLANKKKIEKETPIAPTASAFETGDIVFSEWEEGWLAGEIIEKKGSKYDIYFEKSNEISLMRGDVLYNPVKVSKKREMAKGDIVFFAEQDNKWLAGEVIENNGSKLDICFEDSNSTALMKRTQLYIPSKKRQTRDELNELTVATRLANNKKVNIKEEQKGESDSEESDSEESEDEESELPYDLEYIGDVRLNKLSVQALRQECIKREISISGGAQKKTCISELLEWKNSAEESSSEESEDEESELPYDLHYINESRLSKLSVQALRQQCIKRKRGISIPGGAHKKTCISKLLEWKKDQKAAPLPFGGAEGQGPKKKRRTK